MLSALYGVGIIAALIILGWFLQRFRALPTESAPVLTAFAYWAATPALLFSVLSTEDLSSVVGFPLLVAAGSGVITALAFLAAGWFLKLSRGDMVVGAMGSSLNNIAYIGIPVATYVLGSVHHIVPVLLFQLGFFTPMFFVLAELTGDHPIRGRHPVLRTVFTNPLVIAAIVAVVWNASGIALPLVVSDFTALLGSAAPPVVLVAFGASLVGQSTRLPKKLWAVVGWATFCKLAIQPGAAALLGLAVGLSGPALDAAIVMGALPAAQNVFIAAMRAGVGREIAQGTVLFSSALSLPVIVGVSSLLG